MKYFFKIAILPFFVAMLSCGPSKEERKTASIIKASEPLFLTASEIKADVPDLIEPEVSKKINWESFMNMDSVHYDYIDENRDIYLLSTITWDTNSVSASETASVMDAAITHDASHFLGKKVTKKVEPLLFQWTIKADIYSLWADDKQVGLVFLGVKNNLVYHWMLCGANIDAERLKSLLESKLEALDRTDNPVQAAK